MSDQINKSEPRPPVEAERVDPSWALEPEAPEQQAVPTTYKAGSSEVLGNEPGSTFTATLDPVQEARLIQGGAITKAGTPAEPERKGEDPAPVSPAPAPRPRPNPPASPSGPTNVKEQSNG